MRKHCRNLPGHLDVHSRYGNLGSLKGQLLIVAVGGPSSEAPGLVPAPVMAQPFNKYEGVGGEPLHLHPGLLPDRAAGDRPQSAILGYRVRCKHG